MNTMDMGATGTRCMILPENATSMSTKKGVGKESVKGNKTEGGIPLHAIILLVKSSLKLSRRYSK